MLGKRGSGGAAEVAGSHRKRALEGAGITCSLKGSLLRCGTPNSSKAAPVLGARRLPTTWEALFGDLHTETCFPASQVLTGFFLERLMVPLNTVCGSVGTAYLRSPHPFFTFHSFGLLRQSLM